MNEISSGAAATIHQAEQELARLREALANAWDQIAELRLLADHDSLSGLANRRRLMTEIEAAIERHRLHGRRTALILMDLDGLKRINDRFGHHTGDAAIVHVARIIREAMPRGLAARMGGDEFVLVLADMDEGEARRHAARIAARVAATPLDCETGHHRLSVSTGVAAIDAGTTARCLLGRADAAMYADKRGAA